MPIIRDESDTRVVYEIPEDIKKGIPEYFIPAFAGELCSVYGSFIFEKDEDEVYGLCYIDGSGGWYEAFRMTCKKLNLEWLFEYRDKLPWYDSDRFDGEIEEMIIKQFIEQQYVGANAYYKFLCGEDEGDKKNGSL